MSATEPAAGYSFFPLDESGFQTYCIWHAADDAGQWLSPPTRQWFDYVQNSPVAHAWLVRAENGRALAVVQLDEDTDQRGYVMLVVAPAERGYGHGRRILRALLARPELAQLRVIAGGIDPQNAASLRCVLAAGFVLASPEPDAEGMLDVLYHPPPESTGGQRHQSPLFFT